MTTQKIAESIRQIAPKFAADSADISWLEIELDKVAAKALPKLIRKRFSASFRVTPPVSTAPTSAVSTHPIKHPSGGATV